MLYYILYTILYTLITLTAILTGFISNEGEIDVVKYISALFIKNINIKFQIKKSIINDTNYVFYIYKIKILII